MSPLKQLIEADLILNSQGETLLVGPVHLLNDELRVLIRKNKPELLLAVREAELLTARLCGLTCSSRGSRP